MTRNRFYQLFDTVDSDQEVVDHYLLQYSEIEKQIRDYFIAITPRSGSSWLTELLSSTRVLGNPEEWFNLDNLPGILCKYKSSNINDYIRSVKSEHSTSNGLFGTEASFYQLNLVLQEVKFESLFKDPKFIYLSRKDFLGQGISLFKAVETGYFHSVQEAKKSGEINVSYDTNKIKHWILHILYQEAHWESFFAKRDITPLRIYYEDLVSDTIGTVDKILSFLGVSDYANKLPEQTKHRKISNTRSEEIIESFSSEMEDFLDLCECRRGKPEILQLKA